MTVEMTELELLKKRVEELEKFKEIVSMFFRSVFSRVNSDTFYYREHTQEAILWALEHAFKDMYNHEDYKKFEVRE